jgi:hypothetical protein
MTKSLEESERVAAAGATHPRVSLDDIRDNIAGEWYRTGEEISDADDPELRVLTICLIKLKNGFTVIGKSAPASPENFDPEKGRKFAYDDAVRHVWPLMGYALREKLATNKTDAGF